MAVQSAALQSLAIHPLNHGGGGGLLGSGRQLPPQLTVGRRPEGGGGGGIGGGFREGQRGGGGSRRGLGGGGSGRVGGGGVQVGRLGVVGGGGGHRLPLPPLALPLTRIEYWDRAGGGRNIVQETSTTNEVRTGKWMRASQKGLKMSCIHPFGHHNWTRIMFGKPWF